MQYNLLTSEDQQELAATEIGSEQDMVTDKRPPVENQIVGYNEAQDQYALSQQEKLAMFILASYSSSCLIGKRFRRRGRGFYSWIFNYNS
jgi:hypothetical protein